MIINSKELSNLPKLEKRENAQEPDLNYPMWKIVGEIILSIPKLIFLIPIAIFHIIKGIIWVNKNQDSIVEHTRSQEIELNAKYENSKITIFEEDHSVGFVHFLFNRDGFILFVENLKKALDLDHNPDSHFKRTNWHLHSDFINPELPLEINFYPGNEKIKIDAYYNLYGNPYYYKLMIAEFDEIIREDKDCAVVLDATDEVKISHESQGRIIFEYQNDIK